MNECTKERKILAAEFQKCQKAIIAIGDETRQKIILTLLESEQVGMRVGEITNRTHLSRPAVSHHLQILKDAKIISMRRKGTMNFYYMDANETEWGQLAGLVNHVYDIVKKASEADYPNNYMEYNEN